MLTEARRLCPAKVNLYLKVLGRRADGYHEVVTVMQPLGLADVLAARPAPRLSLECDHPEVPRGPENLVWQAAEKFAQAVGQPLKVHFRLEKRLPVAAGLGGGSSNAAAALHLLNRLAGGPLKMAALHRLAAQLGADVPFFLYSGPALAQGIGTELTPLDLPPYWYVLLNPGFPLSTRWVYESLDLEALFRVGAPALEVLDQGRPETWVANDLETVAFKRYPILQELKEQLRRAGARTAAMSGSGPTLFGLFEAEEAALAAAHELRRRFSGWLAVARGLTVQDKENGWENQAWII